MEIIGAIASVQAPRRVDGARGVRSRRVLTRLYLFLRHGTPRQAVTDTASSKISAGRGWAAPPLSFPSLLLLTIVIGLCGGYLDVVLIVAKKLFLNPEGYYRNAADFPWTVPVGHAMLALVPALALAAFSRLRPRPVSIGTSLWIIITLVLWGALLRLPLYGWCGLILAAGLARPLSRALGDEIVTHGLRSRKLLIGLAASFGILLALAGLSSGSQVIREYWTISRLPSTPPSARNVILIVWDTVRAYNTSLNGYRRDTTPNLVKWAKRGVTYARAVAPAPWTYPSHCSFLTGRWPHQLDSQWKLTLDTPDPTLAEYLSTRGYQTAAFVANTNCCTYESGLARGLAHYDDYVFSPLGILTRTVPGHWFGKNLFAPGNYYRRKWTDLQSRGAREISKAFANWLDGRRTDRPFFVFLNYFDVHEPYIPPRGREGRFGAGPASVLDYRFLFDFVGLSKERLKRYYLDMAMNCYDDCLAFLDAELDLLLNRLQAAGLLANTDVIITSDHGEGFGDHMFFGHGYSVNLDEVGVPLVILSSAAPAGRVVTEAVSLRDLPATVVDLLGLAAESPLPGRSLAGLWRPKADPTREELASPAFSERVDSTAFPDRLEIKSERPTYEMCIASSEHQYIRQNSGAEQLYDLSTDPYALNDLAASPRGKDLLRTYRAMLLEFLTANPGTREVEQAYLRRFRRELEAAVGSGVGADVALDGGASARHGLAPQRTSRAE